MDSEFVTARGAGASLAFVSGNATLIVHHQIPKRTLMPSEIAVVATACTISKASSVNSTHASRVHACMTQQAVVIPHADDHRNGDKSGVLRRVVMMLGSQENWRSTLSTTCPIWEVMPVRLLV